MAPLVIDRTTPTDTIISFFCHVGNVTVQEKSAERVVLSPIIDPADYDNDTDYLNAIPGMREKLLEGINTPLSECEDIPEEWRDV